MSHIDCDVTNRLHAETVSFQNILLILGIYFVIWEHFFFGGGGFSHYQISKKLRFIQLVLMCILESYFLPKVYSVVKMALIHNAAVTCFPP